MNETKIEKEYMECVLMYTTVNKVFIMHDYKDYTTAIIYLDNDKTIETVKRYLVETKHVSQTVVDAMFDKYDIGDTIGLTYYPSTVDIFSVEHVYTTAKILCKQRCARHIERVRFLRDILQSANPKYKGDCPLLNINDMSMAEALYEAFEDMDKDDYQETKEVEIEQIAQALEDTPEIIRNILQRFLEQ